MRRELRDELEVPGHVVAYESLTVEDAKAEINKILDKHKAAGRNKLGEIPEGPDKDRLRVLLTLLNQKVMF